jgi:hypothetical protein
MSDNELFHVVSSAACPSCGYLLPPLGMISAKYFANGSICCANCGAGVDLWEAARLITQVPGVSFFGLQALGANRTTFIFQLAPGETREIDLTRYGVPEEATVLSMNYTPNGYGCLPLEVHGNTPRRRLIGTKLHIYGRPVEGGAGAVPIAISATWAHHGETTESWFYLVDAMEAMATRRFWHVILPAHSAVEVAMMPLVRDGLERHLPRQRAQDFTRGLGIQRR